MENEYAALINILGNFGFLVMITIYLFVRFENKIENLANDISDLSIALKELKR
ncbi:YvrJ family protein [Bacilli bacterium]|nr:YvrJ family protein [Bacilli bacterium]